MHPRGTEDAETGYWRKLCVLAVSVANSPNSLVTTNSNFGGITYG